MQKHRLGLALCLIMCATWAAQANTALENRLQNMLRDKALDRGEYIELQTLDQGALNAEEKELQQKLLKDLKRYAHRRQVHFQQTLSSGRKIDLKFIFVRSYSENDQIKGKTPRAILSQISQHDILSDTQNSTERCGAASLLAAHYWLYGSWKQAFQTLEIKELPFNYASMHRAQEKVFDQVKTRHDKIGLVTAYKYSIRPDGSIYNIRSGGEIQEAARLLGLINDSILGPSRDRLYEREAIIQDYWRQHPRAVFLVGVHNSKKNRISPPTQDNPQNHYVLLFQDAGKYYLYNSGVWDNAKGSAIKRLKPQDLQAWLYYTRGSINALRI